VTCPLLRIHPAIVAQAAATTQELFEGRFFLGLGTGENLPSKSIFWATAGHAPRSGRRCWKRPSA
jgi:alkanesulfonate monooxygenase SsuD/methylene tetrahydromethanopterin reductase-like flavin-dependent oxidoreductase (luciferase family)